MAEIRRESGVLPRDFPCRGPTLRVGVEEKEKFRALMRLQENFTGCRATSYCLMDNHFHILLEVPPMAEGGLSDEGLLERLSAIYNEVVVAGVAKELAVARTVVYANETGLDEAVKAIHERFTYRMHDLGEFMKGLLQRYTQWHNRAMPNGRRLWPEKFRWGECCAAGSDISRTGR